jgi:hypothetical protein
MSAERLRSPDRSTTREVPTASVDFAIAEGWTRIPKIDMRTPDGNHVLLDEDRVADALAAGWWRMTDDEARAASAELQRSAAEQHHASAQAAAATWRWYVAAWSAAALLVGGYGQIFEREQDRLPYLAVAAVLAFVAVVRLLTGGRR